MMPHCRFFAAPLAVYCLALLAFGGWGVVVSHAFGAGTVPRIPARRPAARPTGALFLSTAATSNEDSSSDVAQMRVAEIRAALNELAVDYTDCFDKESLVQRLQEARQRDDKGKKVAAPSASSKCTPASVAEDEEKASSSSRSSRSDEEKEEKKEAPATPKATRPEHHEPPQHVVDDDIHSMSVKALRAELAARNRRWAGLLEKRDLIQAVYEARQAAAQFSVTGLVAPGTVADLTGEQLQREMEGTSSLSLPPLLCDIYATWCGPCQLLIGQLKEVAAVMGDRLRIVKMDSDQHPDMASRLHTQGLPTLILFDNNGREVDRLEGALMKDQLLEWIESRIR